MEGQTDARLFEKILPEARRWRFFQKPEGLGLEAGCPEIYLCFQNQIQDINQTFFLRILWINHRIRDESKEFTFRK